MNRRRRWNVTARRWRGAKKSRQAVRWFDDMKESASAFRNWGRSLMIIGAVMAFSLLAIAVELFVICVKV